jgi:hypothetical protein
MSSEQYAIRLALGMVLVILAGVGAGVVAWISPRPMPAEYVQLRMQLFAC